tara:strand:- start:216 stop:506 length:291 start_codon:yes stop_codon:yes gene_type:complete
VEGRHFDHVIQERENLQRARLDGIHPPGFCPHLVPPRESTRGGMACYPTPLARLLVGCMTVSLVYSASLEDGARDSRPLRDLDAPVRVILDHEEDV